MVAFDRGYERVEHHYRESLRWCIERPVDSDHRRQSGAAGRRSFVIVPQLGFTFAPEQDQGIVAVIVESPPGSSLSYTKTITDQVEAEDSR